MSTPEALGSGCTPPSGVALLDGNWFGHVEEWGQEQIEFDLYCINDNQEMVKGNQDTYQLPVSGRAQYLIDEALFAFSSGSGYAFSYADVVAARDEYPPPTYSSYVWAYVNGGEVTQVQVWHSGIGTAAVEGSPYLPRGPRLEPAEGAPGEYFPAVETNQHGITNILTPNNFEAGLVGVLGSGCSPGSGDALPDGVWFGYINEMTDATLTFDLACNWSYESWESGPDTEECWTVEGTGLRNERCNDRLASNDDKRLRTNPLASDAQVLNGGPDAYSAVTIGGLESQFWPFDPTYGNWIYVNDGEVTAIAPWSRRMGWSHDEY